MLRKNQQRGCGYKAVFVRLTDDDRMRLEGLQARLMGRDGRVPSLSGTIAEALRLAQVEAVG